MESYGWVLYFNLPFLPLYVASHLVAIIYSHIKCVLSLLTIYCDISYTAVFVNVL